MCLVVQNWANRFVDDTPNRLIDWLATQIINSLIEHVTRVWALMTQVSVYRFGSPVYRFNYWILRLRVSITELHLTRFMYWITRLRISNIELHVHELWLLNYAFTDFEYRSTCLRVLINELSVYRFSSLTYARTRFNYLIVLLWALIIELRVILSCN